MCKVVCKGVVQLLIAVECVLGPRPSAGPPRHACSRAPQSATAAERRLRECRTFFRALGDEKVRPTILANKGQFT